MYPSISVFDSDSGQHRIKTRMASTGLAVIPSMVTDGGNRSRIRHAK